MRADLRIFRAFALVIALACLTGLFLWLTYKR